MFFGKQSLRPAPSKDPGHRQVRRLKRLLRPLPRRATLHRYPVLCWFQHTARKRSYLWSFRLEHIIPALYAGSVLALVPVYGLQLLTAFVLALVLRANLMVFTGLQLITNPLSALPVYGTCCYVGLQLMQFCGYQLPDAQGGSFAWTIAAHVGEAVQSAFGSEGASERLAELSESTGLSLLEVIWLAMRATTLGGFVLGIGLGAVLSLSYKQFLRHYRMKHGMLTGRKVVPMPGTPDPAGDQCA